ncbi:MAG: AAA family ATPase [Chloroflexota bacterium]
MESTRATADTQMLMSSLGKLPQPVTRPVLIMVSGLPGTGKSHLSRRLAENVPVVILESDALRKALFLQPEYTAAENTLLFRAVHRLLGDLLQRGISAVLDATNLSELFRERIYRIAEQTRARLIIIRVAAPAAVVKQRLAARARKAARSDHSEATWDIYQKMLPDVQPINRNHFVVDTSRDIGPVIRKIRRAVRQ